MLDNVPSRAARTDPYAPTGLHLGSISERIADPEASGHMGVSTAKRAGVELELSMGQRVILDAFRRRALAQPGTIFEERSERTARMLHRLDLESEGRFETVLDVIDALFADEHACSIGISLEMVYLLWSAKHTEIGLASIQAFLPEPEA